MLNFSLRIFLLLAVVVWSSGCSLFHKKKPESSAHIYEGDSPNLHFSDKPEKPGGPVNAY